MLDEIVNLVGGEVAAALLYGIEDCVSLSAASIDHEETYPTAPDSHCQ